MQYRDSACQSDAETETPPPAFLRLFRIAMSMRKRAPHAMTIDEAMDHAIEENPGLYDSYLQMVAWCARSGQPLPSAFVRQGGRRRDAHPAGGKIAAVG